MKLNEAFAKRVKQVLRDKNMTQYKLGLETGIYHSTMTDILTCKYKSPNFRNMVLIIKALGISMPDFFDCEEFSFNNLEIEEK